MKELSVKNNPMHAWYDLVIEAEGYSHILLPENTEYYLVSVLTRYTNQPQFINNVLGELYLQLIDKPIQQVQLQLRDIGDQCLLFAGLFPEYARRRLVSDDYFPGLGKAAYDQLALYEGIESNSVYLELVQYFECMLRILRAFRGISQFDEGGLSAICSEWSNINHGNSSH